MYYIDTSALVAVYLPETKSSKIQSFLTKSVPVISLLTEVEFCSAVAKKVRQKELEKDQGHEVIALFNEHLESEIYKKTALTVQHYHFARYCISQLKAPLRTLDALHLAVASLGQLELVTTDKALAKSAKLFRVKCKLI